MKQKIPTTWKKLYQTALKVRKNAYAPYSNYFVGAALEVRHKGKLHVFQGCNMENASYGASVCAERGALQRAIIDFGGDHLTIVRLAVVTSSAPPALPCGLCRQVLAEFGMDFPVLAANTDGDFEEFSFEYLLPTRFSKKDLLKHVDKDRGRRAI